jgi:CheY-like chemotaxis protein
MLGRLKTKAMVQVLVIDDDLGTLDTFSAILRHDGCKVAVSSSGRDGLFRALRDRYDLLICDVRLGDISGLEIVRELRNRSMATPVVLVTGFGSTLDAVEAMRLGATDYVEKPLIDLELIAVARRALSRNKITSEPAATPPFHSEIAVRWADIVIPVVDSPRDLKTLDHWAHYLAVSRSSLKTWCYTVGVSPRRSLIFARLLRAVALRARHRTRPEESLNFADRRTLVAMLKFAGLFSKTETGLPHTCKEFLARQTLVRDEHLIRELTQRLQARGLYAVGENDS